jgi:diguanylate cyclase (GGDEF)-like protein/PAS domain S-box-containing protein
MIRVAIAGAGKAGLALLDIFQSNGVVKNVGITDTDENAPALLVAREWGVFIAKDIGELLAQEPDVVINVTGDADVGRMIREMGSPHTEVIEGTGARFLWGLVQRQKDAKKDMETIYRNGLVLTSSKKLENVLNATLEKAMELTETPAGSIALCERNEMVMAAWKGLSSEILNVPRWTPRQNGLTAYILKHKEPVEIQDIGEYPFADSYALREEGIQSVLAYPLKINGDIVGIIYLDDFKPRHFSDRHKNLIRLFGMQAAQAIDKFRILDELYRVIGELDETTAYFKNVLDDSQDMIATTDNDGRIVEFSRGGERILGYTREEIIGRKASDFYRDRSEREQVLDTLRSKGAVCNHETRLVRKDGTPVDISLTISRLTDKAGRVVGTVGVSKDITEEKRLRHELQSRNEELKYLNLKLEDKVLERTRELEKINRELTKANQIKARFISNMSHELRTPLNSILGFSDILLENTFGELNERQRRHISNINASGKHLLQLISNILDLAKIEAGKIELFPEEFRIPDAIDEVVMIMNSLAARKSIAIDTGIRPGVDLFTADKVKFKQILYNLIANAIKFSPEGAAVEIGAEPFLNRGGALPWALEGQVLLKVYVKDRGIGIKEEDIERIFEEFEQADPSMSRNYQGTGLGLALTRRLVDLHGGRISVDSTYGEGSEFVFYLPAAETGEKEQETPAWADPSPATYPWAGEEGPLVLVVEDDLPTSEILTIHLTKAGYRVVHAYDGVEAIAKAKEEHPFVITLDVMLPKKDGWEVLQSLKADTETKDIPVIIHSIIDNRDLAYTLGAADYLLKPVDKNVLLDKLKEFSFFAKRHELPASVLLISDDCETQDRVCSIATDNGFLFRCARGREEGRELSAAARPHIIIVDLGTHGFDIIRGLKGDAATAGIPIFALTNRNLSVEERLSMTGQIERILRKDEMTANDLVGHLKDLEILHPKRAGLVDDLTGLFNHRYFQLRLAQEVSRSARYKTPLTLTLLDIDGFGRYVKSKGDYYGNLVLKKTAELLMRNIRGSDIVVRYGGDAFGVILPNTLLGPAVSLGRRFSAIIYDYPFLHEEAQPKGRLTVSVGVASFAEQTPEELIRGAEAALASAVRKGGNTLEVFDDRG